MAELTLEDQKVTLPMAELGAITNKIRSLRYSVTGWERPISWLPRSTRAAFAARLQQIAIKAEPVILLAVDEAVDRLLADANKADAVSQKTPGNLFR